MEEGWYIARRKDARYKAWVCVRFDGTHVYDTLKFQYDFLPEVFEFHSKITMPDEE